MWTAHARTRSWPHSARVNCSLQGAAVADSPKSFTPDVGGQTDRVHPATDLTADEYAQHVRGLPLHQQTVADKKFLDEWNTAASVKAAEQRVKDSKYRGIKDHKGDLVSIRSVSSKISNLKYLCFAAWIAALLQNGHTFWPVKTCGDLALETK